MFLAKRFFNMIPIFEPKISVKAKINVNKALKDNWISSQGNFINQFEKIS